MSRLRVPINLSSDPFRRDRPIAAATALLAALLTVLLAVQALAIVRQREAATDARAANDRLQAQMRAVQSESAQLQDVLQQPANAAIVDRNAFLNMLLQRKGISWTRMFEDLQSVFPHNVRLVSVRPFVTPDNHIQLEMVVGAQSPEPIITLLRQLETSNLFGATAVTAWQPPAQNEPLYRYRVSVSYAQKL